MIISIFFSVLIAVSFIRTNSYGIYCLKTSGLTAGISVFILAATPLFCGVAILITQMN